MRFKMKRCVIPFVVAILITCPHVTESIADRPPVNNRDSSSQTKSRHRTSSHDNYDDTKQ